MDEIVPEKNGWGGRRRNQVGRPRLSDQAKALKRPEGMQRLTEMFAKAGFTADEAVERHVSHIRGDGDTPPKFDALAMYWRMTVPRPVQKVEIRQTSVLGIFGKPEVNAIEARELKNVTTEKSDE